MTTRVEGGCQCGQVRYRLARRPDFQTGWRTPGAHIWVSRKQPWLALDPRLPAHPTQPDDLDAWRHARRGDGG